LLSACDNSLFYLINKGCSSHLFNAVMPLLTELGSGKVLLITAIALILFRNKKARRFGILLLIALVLSYGIVYILKIWIARPRPSLVLAHVHLLAKEKGYSFPSGHAAYIFMAVSLLAAYFKKFYPDASKPPRSKRGEWIRSGFRPEGARKKRILGFRPDGLHYLYIVAFGVAFSRIYLGVHFPSDVIAGALIGTIIGVSISKISPILLFDF